MNPVPLVAAGALMVGGIAVSHFGMTGHMIGHMTAVAIAAPLLAIGTRGTRYDPAQRWPRLVTPFVMSLVELAIVWSWHLPTVRAMAAHSAAAMLMEQACFLGAGFLLWSAVISRPADARASGVGALLLTSMHMTLLGALIALAPRTLYGMTHGVPEGLTSLQDQQLSGVVMLMIGGVAYLLGALAVLGGLLRQESVKC